MLVVLALLSMAGEQGLSARTSVVSGRRGWPEPHLRMRLWSQRMGCLHAPLNIPKIELINFFGRVETVVGGKSPTLGCVAPGFCFLPWGSPLTHIPFKCSTREQRILLIILKALCP